jgi:hypothetical protein
MTKRFRKTVVSVLAVGMLGAPALTFAFGDGTPDEQPPAEEIVCDPAAELRGAAYGLCVAYCEANDCPIQPDKQACDVLLKNFTRITGEDDIPCAVSGPN